MTPYYTSNGTVDGDEGAEVMAVGYTDSRDDDEIDRADGLNDTILGKGGSDTINGGAGNDTIQGDYADLIGRLAPSMPAYTFAGSPSGTAAGAEVDTFTINNAAIDNNGLVDIDIRNFATKEDANDVTIIHGGTEAITEITVTDLGGNEGESDVIRFDLSSYYDDFLVTVAGQSTEDIIVFEGVHSVSDNGDGTWNLTYFGNDAAPHSVTVDPANAHVEFYVTADSPYFYDDVIDAGDGDDFVDGGYGADSLTGGLGADTLIGNIGNDTITGNYGADEIYGDWDQVLTAEIAPGSAGTAELDTFSIGDAQINAGAVAIGVDQFATPGNENDVLITDDAATESITSITLSKMGNGDSQQDIFRFDLSTFDDDFTISVASEGIEDRFVFEDVFEATDNGDGIWTITYYGEDNALHTVTVTPGTAQVDVYYAPVPDSLIVEADDVLSGGAGNDTIDGGYGDDSIDAGADNDLVDGGVADDTILGAGGLDTIDGGAGNDSIDAGTEADSVDGGLGHDNIVAGDGADTIYGGDSVPDVPLERVAFNWSDVPDPNDGGQIDNLDAITSGSQTAGGAKVSFSVTGGAGQFETTTVYTSGIDAGAGSVNTNSALGLDGADGVLTMDFSTPVENLQFNINDFEANSETIFIQAYDAQGNLIPFTVIQGSGITGSDTDTISGADTFQGPLSNIGDNSVVGSIAVSIPGPIATLVIDFSQTNGSLTMTDVWFDDPATGIEGGGDDSIDAGDGDDVIYAGKGTDAIDGGLGTDTYDADFSGDLTDETISVVLDGNGD